MFRSRVGGFFSWSILRPPSSTLVPWSSVYLSPLNDQVASSGTVWPNWTHDSMAQSPSSFLRSLSLALSLTPGAAVVDRPARQTSPTASKTGRIIGHLLGLRGRYRHRGRSPP